MNTLMIDSSSEIELVSISTSETTEFISKAVDRSHSKTILSNIEIVLKKSGLKIHDIELIGVGIGPGSFTGIRIAVSTARMLAQVLSLPIVGIKSQLLFAISADAQPGDNILVAFDAKKNRVFGALYRKTGNNRVPSEIITPGDYDISTLIENADRGKMTYSMGNGAEKYIKILDQDLKRHKFSNGVCPSGEEACRLALKIYKEGNENFMDYNRIVPFYARVSDAEISLLQKIDNKDK